MVTKCIFALICLIVLFICFFYTISNDRKMYLIYVIAFFSIFVLTCIILRFCCQGQKKSKDVKQNIAKSSFNNNYVNN